jgi:hypothetical protein
MTTEIALTLAIIVAALALFATEKLRVDLVALLALLSVGLLRLVNPEEVFDGFANPAVITVWAVYIVSGGLFRIGRHLRHRCTFDRGPDGPAAR